MAAQAYYSLPPEQRNLGAAIRGAVTDIRNTVQDLFQSEDNTNATAPPASSSGTTGETTSGTQTGTDTPSGGRLGSPSTRAKDAEVAADLEKQGAKVTHGAGKKQEYIPGPGGAKKGSAYPDVTARQDGKTVRVNTIDTLKDGKTPTQREQRAINKIKKLKPNDEVKTVPKDKKR